MQCNCNTEIEAKLLQRFKEKFPKATNHSAELMGYAIGITETMGMVLVGVSPVEFVADHSLKTGGTKRKTLRQSMHFSFCPFCGLSATPNKSPMDQMAEKGESDAGLR